MGIFFKVIFLEDVLDYLRCLDSKISEKIIYNIRKSQVEINQDLFKKLNDEIWEFRTLYKGIQYRLLAFWDKNSNDNTVVIVVTNAFVKKTSKVPAKEIFKAKQLRKEYFRLKK